jgi:hypothetical protein
MSEDLKTPEVLKRIAARMPMPQEVIVRGNGGYQENLAANTASYAPPDERTRLHKLASELDRRPLQEIAFRLAHLTYGEMVEYCEGIGGDPAKVWEWAVEHKSAE